MSVCRHRLIIHQTTHRSSVVTTAHPPITPPQWRHPTPPPTTAVPPNLWVHWGAALHRLTGASPSPSDHAHRSVSGASAPNHHAAQSVIDWAPSGAWEVPASGDAMGLACLALTYIPPPETPWHWSADPVAPLPPPAPPWDDDTRPTDTWPVLVGVSVQRVCARSDRARLAVPHHVVPWRPLDDAVGHLDGRPDRLGDVRLTPVAAPDEVALICHPDIALIDAAVLIEDPVWCRAIARAHAAGHCPLTAHPTDPSVSWAGVILEALTAWTHTTTHAITTDDALPPLLERTAYSLVLIGALLLAGAPSARSDAARLIVLEDAVRACIRRYSAFQAFHDRDSCSSHQHDLMVPQVVRELLGVAPPAPEELTVSVPARPTRRA